MEGSGAEGLDKVGGGVGGEAGRWADGRVGGTPSAAAAGDVGRRAAGGRVTHRVRPDWAGPIFFLFYLFSFFSASFLYFSFENLTEKTLNFNINF